MEAYELHYSDLILLSSSVSSVPTSGEEMGRLESMKRDILEALGPAGPGLLTVTGVPNASVLRLALLPLARKLALLTDRDRKPILKEHGLGSDVSLKNPDRVVSSFAKQLSYAQALESKQYELSQNVTRTQNSKRDQPSVDTWKECQENEFENLSYTFKELGFCMMELGVRLARICDSAIGGHELEKSLLESGSAKGRLIHYHSRVDNLKTRESVTKSKSTKGQATCKCQTRNAHRDQAEAPNLDSSAEVKTRGDSPSLWQQWHYDYGIFTILTAPFFILPSHSQKTKAEVDSSICCEQEGMSPSGHTYLQIFNPNKNQVLTVKASPGSFIVQVGESADVLSRGRLRSTLHSVCRPGHMEDLSRETFVVFLQPAWSKTFSVPDYLTGCPGWAIKDSSWCGEKTRCIEQKGDALIREILKTIPPLSSRLKDGMAFAEFSRETTKQYYGGSGLQSNR